MTSLLTSSAADAALATLRNARGLVDETQRRIATGLKVRDATDQPAFFLVSQSLQGDSTLNNGVADNLVMSRNAVLAGEAAVETISELLNEIRETLLVANTGIALREAQFALENIRSEIIGAIRTASFNGTNFLATDIQRQIVGSVSNSGGTTDINYFLIEGAGLDTRRASSEIGSLGAGEPNPTTSEEFAAVAILPILEAAYDPTFLSLVDLNGDGLYQSNSAADDADLTRAGRQISEAAFNRLQVVVQRLNDVGYNIDINELVNIGGSNAQNAANPSDPPLYRVQAPGNQINPASLRLDLNGDDNLSAFTTLANIPGTVSEINNAGRFFGIITQDTILEGIRATVDSITPPTTDLPLTFVQRLNTINIVDGFNTETGLAVIEDLQQELNFAGAKLGAVGKRIDAQIEFSRTLTNSLDLGSAALIEADLDEESTRLQAGLVQEALAIQSLSIVNARLGERLALFNSALGAGSVAELPQGAVDTRV